MTRDAGSPITASTPQAASLAESAIGIGRVQRDDSVWRRWSGPLLVLALLAATHFLVDFVAGTVNPLWPTLEDEIPGVDDRVLWIYVPWMIATSFSQLLFGLCADRLSLRWLIWGGPVAALLGLSCIGLAPNIVALVALFVLGGLGIAAFHPEAAALAGTLIPQQRSRAMAIFALSGYLGQACGPSYSGWVTQRWGLSSLTWGLVWGGAILLVLMVALSLAKPPRVGRQSSSRTGQRVPRGRVLFLVLAIGSLRITPALGVPFTLAFLLRAAEASPAMIGGVQTAFMAGIGIGAMVCAALVRHDWERAAIWLLPLCASPVLIALPFTLTQGWILVGLVGLSGLLLGVTMPIYISYGQQLIPQSPRVASSITMGVSWGIASGIMAATFYPLRSADVLGWMFPFFAGTCIVSSVLCRWLPVPTRDAPASRQQHTSR